MANASRYSTLNRIGTGLFVWFVLHWVPLPCPILPLKSFYPPEHWDSLRFFDPPWGLGYSFHTFFWLPREIRDLGWVMLFYEPVLLALTMVILYRFPHRLMGRD